MRYIFLIVFASLLFSFQARAGDSSAGIADAVLFESISIARASLEEKINIDFPEQGEGSLWGNIKNYSMGVLESEREVIVVFMPRHDRGSLIGGGGEYRINKESKK